MILNFSNSLERNQLAPNKNNGYLLPAGVLVGVGGISGQAVLPGVESTGGVSGNKLGGNSALVAASEVRDKSGDHASPESIEFSHDGVDSSADVARVAGRHVTDVIVLVPAASVVMDDHVAELVPVIVSGLKHKSYSN